MPTHLDESQRQTELIHSYQRFSKTKEAIDLKQKSLNLITLHQNIQRLLRPLPVIIPYAQRLSFPTDSPSSRRENQKLLTLIEAVTLLHQHQRKMIIKNSINYIESTKQDYQVAFDLFSRAFRNNLVMAHPKAQVLLTKINNMNKPAFTRKDIANYTGWPDYRVRDNIRYLEEEQLLHIIKKTKGKELLYRLNTTINLTKPEELEENHSSTS